MFSQYNEDLVVIVVVIVVLGLVHTNVNHDQHSTQGSGKDDPNTSCVAKTKTKNLSENSRCKSNIQPTLVASHGSEGSPD